MTTDLETKKSAKKYSPEIRSRAVRMVLEHEGNYRSRWEAMTAVASTIGCIGETLRRWVRQHERDAGLREGLTSDDRANALR